MSHRTEAEKAFDALNESKEPIQLYDKDGNPSGTMTMAEGINRHGRSMGVHSPKKTRIVFAYPTAGYDHHIKTAAEHLEVGKTYTVDRTEIHSWHTDVYLEEVPDVRFNSVMFVEESDYVSSPSSSSDSGE